MRRPVFYIASLAILVSVGSNVLAQNVNPGGMGVPNDPRQPHHTDPADSTQKTTGDVLRGMGFKVTQSSEEKDNNVSWSGDLNGQLVMAIGDDDPVEAVRLIKAGADANGDVAGGGLTPLMMAQSPAMVSALIDNDADPRRRDSKGATALHYLLFAERAEEILPILIDSGADINAVVTGANRETPLLAARQLFFEGGDHDRAKRIIRLLYKSGASINAQDADGYTALITAAVNNKLELAQLMLFLKAEPHIRTIDGMTALAWARELGHSKIEEMLLTAGARE